jgi:hypothetical protein
MVCCVNEGEKLLGLSFRSASGKATFPPTEIKTGTYRKQRNNESKEGEIKT